MTEIYHIHPQNPQPRLIMQAVERVLSGQVIVYPTDSDYAIGCQLGNKDAIERIRRIRQLDKSHNFTLICKDLSEIASYARIDNPIFRYLKAHTPGPYTFILPATREVPRRLQHPKRKTIGIRVPKHIIIEDLLIGLKQPLMSVSLLLPGDELPLCDMDVICERLDGQVDLIIDGGPGDVQATSIIDLTSGTPEVIRAAKGWDDL